MGYHKFCSASGMFVENRIDNFDAQIRRLVYGFYQRLMCSRNSLVNCVMNNSAWLSSDLYRNWNKCLYVSERVLFTCFFLLFSLLSFTLSPLKLELVLRYFCSFSWLQTTFIFFFFIMYILCKCYSIYGIPVIVYYVVYVTWKPAIKLLYIYITLPLSLYTRIYIYIKQYI